MTGSSLRGKKSKQGEIIQGPVFTTGKGKVPDIGGVL